LTTLRKKTIERARIDDNKSIEEKAGDVGKAVGKGVKEGVDKIKKEINKEKAKIVRARRG
jgi:hypothetical protein